MKILVNNIDINFKTLILKTDYGECTINIEIWSTEKLLKAQNKYKPLYSPYDLIKKLLIPSEYFTEVHIESVIEGDYKCFLYGPNQTKIEYPISISDAMVYTEQSKIPIYIESSLILTTVGNLELKLDEAIKSENFELAKEITDELKRLNSRPRN